MSRKVCLLVLFLIIYAGVAMADVNIAATFPDPVLRSLVEKYDRYMYDEKYGRWEYDEKYADGVLSDYELREITEIYNDIKDDVIRDLTGIKALKYLKRLDLDFQEIATEINVSGMEALESLNITGVLVSIDASNCPNLV